MLATIFSFAHKKMQKKYEQDATIKVTETKHRCKVEMSNREFSK